METDQVLISYFMTPTTFTYLEMDELTIIKTMGGGGFHDNFF